MGNRRDFLKKSIGLASLAAFTPDLWVRTAKAQAAGVKTLVVLQLGGGNDGLNTIVPYSQGAYYDARPTIGIPESQVIDLNGSFGFHPNLAALTPLYQAQKLAVIQGVGYPQPNRSHFRSMDIWQTAEPIELEQTGWLGRFADMHLLDKGELAAVNIGGSLPKSFNAENIVVPSIVNLQSYQFLTDPQHTGDRTNQINTFLSCNNRPTATGDEQFLAETALGAYNGSSELQTAASGYTPKATYPTSRLATDLQFAAQIITSGVGARVIYVATGGYDTHANQPNDQGNLHRTMAEALAAFQADIEGQGLADNVILIAFSEFGRRVNENGSDGTDHGTAGPMFALGNSIQGGVHGQLPSLTSLDGNGDLIFTVDFREVYAEVLDTWLGVNSRDILGDTYSHIGIL